MAGPYLERSDTFDPIFGYHQNRIVDALTNNRPNASVAMIEAITESMTHDLIASTSFRWPVFVPTLQTDTIIKAYLHFYTNVTGISTLAVDGTDRTTALGGPWAVGAISNVNLTPYITTTGWHNLDFTSTGTPVLFAYFQLQSLFNNSV